MSAARSERTTTGREATGRAGSTRVRGGAAPGSASHVAESWTTGWPAPAVFGAFVGLFAAGFGVGGLGAFAHPMRPDIGVRVPLGLLLALLCIGGIVVSAGVVTRSRIGAGVPALGWAACVLLLTQPRADGDLLIAATGLGYAYLLGGLVTLGALVCLPYRGRPAPPAKPGGGSSRSPAAAEGRRP